MRCPFFREKITKLTNKVCFLSTNASYGMRLESGTANKFPPQGEASPRDPPYGECKKPISNGFDNAICIHMYMNMYSATIISDLQKTWGKSNILRLQHLERCKPQVGLSYEQITVEIRETQPQVTSLLSPNETGKTPSIFKATPKACSDITWNRGAGNRKWC